MSQPDPDTVRTRILIISDTHSAPLVDPEAADASENDQRQRNKAFRKPLPSADVLLHCGDITMAGHMHEYESALEILGSIDAPLKLVIAGNHDITLDEDFYLGDSGGSLTGWTNGQRMHMKNYDPDLPKQAKALWTGDAAKSKGVTFLDEGIHEFTLHNGAKLTVYASPWQPEFCNWAFNYDHSHDCWNPPDLSAPDAVNVAINPVPADPGGKIDIMMTHGPPRDRLDSTSSGPVGCPHLLRAVARARPRVHAWGHIHEAWGVERVEWANGDENLEKKGSAKIWDFMRKNKEADGPRVARSWTSVKVERRR
ncbi:ser thr protein phosphatase family protein [Neofusicoccum parvum]|uniref:Ser thr protein phosphatase family protein n=1 Tax=Neofusicoccum parvum TaxID=310453 RepID=A0ACB5SI30_9PEZI|nr:ser thr protein phosphatase family protein [Neofusicoccum parvum]